GLAVAAHDLRRERGVLAVQRDRQGAGLLACGVVLARGLLGVLVGLLLGGLALLVGRVGALVGVGGVLARLRRGVLGGLGGLDGSVVARRGALLLRGTAGGEGEDEGGEGRGGAQGA